MTTNSKSTALMKSPSIFLLFIFLSEVVGDPVQNDLKHRKDWSKSKIPWIIPAEYRTENPKIQPTDSTTERIIGGEVVPVGEYPYHVGIVPNFGAWCGGSLISNQHILTAAHCTFECSFVHVYLGAHNIRDDEESQLEFKILFDDIKHHPDWDWTVYSDDISIVSLPQTIQFTNRIQPIALPSRSDDNLDFEYQFAIATGWGYIFENSTSITNLLRFSNLQLLPHPVCQHFYPRIFRDTNLCTNDWLGPGLCTRDDGGPIMFQRKDGTRILVGIISLISPVGCADGWVTMHTKVSMYLDWISTVTGIAIRN